jgi:hypothetical protein
MKMKTTGLSVALAILCVLSWLPAQDSNDEKDAKEQFTDWGRTSRQVIPDTEAGIWDGTWFYVNRDAHMAMWLKTEDGVPQVKFRYRSLASIQGFETDWEGNADYIIRDMPARFSLNISKRDVDRIEGRWVWEVQMSKASRVEQGAYRMYRTGDGRFFVMEFDKLERVINLGEEEKVLSSSPSWTFRKASKRLVLWDELPF